MKPCYRVPGWIEDDKAKQAFFILRDSLDWLDVVGNRLEYWTNTLDASYTYGKGVGSRKYESKPSHPIIDHFAERLLNAVGVTFNACFVNYYRDGYDSIGWHADDDLAIDHDKPIAVVTLGHGRRIEWKSKEKGSHPESYFLDNGSLFVMNPRMQLTHYHRIPKEPSYNEVIVGPRISLTYRVLK